MKRLQPISSRKEGRDQSVSAELDVVRGLLGDVGLPHDLLRTKGGWPYIRFQIKGSGRISVQYRRERGQEGTDTYRKGRYLLFMAVDPSKAFGPQQVEYFSSPEEVMGFLGYSAADLEEGRRGREGVPKAERPISIPKVYPALDPEIEQSYVAMMR